SDLSKLTAYPSGPEGELHANPRLREVVERCRTRILEVELARGENPTAATRPARALSSVIGLDYLMRFLKALGDRPFDREYSGLSRAAVFTRLIRVTSPAPKDTREEFAPRIGTLETCRHNRLIQLAFLAPQWLPHVEYTLGWEGLREGVWWFFAHMSEG